MLAVITQSVVVYGKEAGMSVHIGAKGPCYGRNAKESQAGRTHHLRAESMAPRHRRGRSPRW